MHKQRGSAMAVLAVFLGLFGLLAVTCVGSYISANNTANSFEQALAAASENSQSILAQYGQKIAEAAQIPGMMRDDVSQVTRQAIEGRYGQGGSKAVIQVLKEQNPQLSEALYVKIQQLVESGRDEFKTSQTRVIDTKRAYKTALGSFWTGLWMRVAGYPKVNPDSYKIVTTERAQDAFKDGIEKAPLVIRPTTPN